MEGGKKKKKNEDEEMLEELKTMCRKEVRAIIEGKESQMKHLSNRDRQSE